MRAPTITVGTRVLALLGLAGCATLGDVVREKDQGGGTTQAYPVDALIGFQGRGM